MYIKFSKYCLLAVLLLGDAVLALEKDPIDNADAAELNEMAVPTPSSSEMVTEAIDAYFERRGINEGVIGAGGKVYYRAVKRVSASPARTDWVASRQIAFEKALLKARSAFVFDNFGRSTVNAGQIKKEDNSSNADKFDSDTVSKSKLIAVYDKAVALGDAKLNSLLEEVGVDSSEYDSVPEAQRRELYFNSYITTSIKKAMGDSSGLIPIQTFEGNDAKGNHSVGVVLVRSDKLQQLASDMSRQREPFLTAKRGKPLSAYIDYPPEQLATQFGVRVVFNEQGKPVVLSYGQWGFGYKGKNDSRLDRERSHAADKADIVASDGLTTFMNSKLAYTNESISGEVISESITKQGDEITAEDVTNVIDKMEQQIKLNASAKLNGTRIVKRWKYKHPYGHEIIGRVRMWSMEGVDQSRDIVDFKPSSQKTGENRIDDRPRDTKAGIQTGLNFDDEEEAF